MVNGALLTVGAAAVVDNLVFHWLLGWHRLIEDAPDPEVLLLEVAVVAVGVAVVATGVWRERRARRG